MTNSNFIISKYPTHEWIRSVWSDGCDPNNGKLTGIFLVPRYSIIRLKKPENSHWQNLTREIVIGYTQDDDSNRPPKIVNSPEFHISYCLCKPREIVFEYVVYRTQAWTYRVWICQDIKDMPVQLRMSNQNQPIIGKCPENERAVWFGGLQHSEHFKDTTATAITTRGQISPDAGYNPKYYEPDYYYRRYNRYGWGGFEDEFNGYDYRRKDLKKLQFDGQVGIVPSESDKDTDIKHSLEKTMHILHVSQE